MVDDDKAFLADRVLYAAVDDLHALVYHRDLHDSLRDAVLHGRAPRPVPQSPNFAHGRKICGFAMFSAGRKEQGGKKKANFVDTKTITKKTATTWIQ